MTCTLSWGRRFALGPVAMLCAGALLIGCAEESAPAHEGSVGTSKPAPMAGQAPAARTLQPVNIPTAPPPSPTDQKVGEILRRTLNATVDDQSRFEAAPLYELELDLDYDLFTYSAHERIRFTNSRADQLTEIVLYAYPNSPEMVSAGMKNLAVGDTMIDGTPVEPRVDGPRIRVPLPSPLRRGESVVLDMDFKANIHRLAPGDSDIGKLAVQQLLDMVMGGTERSGGYGVFSVGDRIVSLGLWYPILANYDENGWDASDGGPVGDVSYFDVANYDVTVSAPSDVAIVSTGVEVERREERGRAHVHFQAGAVREFTLQMSREYEHASAFVDGIRVTSWYTRGHQEPGQRVLRHGQEALRLFNSLFGPYPYTELDLVEAPLVGGAGGVEFPGLVTIARMFYIPQDTAPDPGNPMAALASSRYLKDTLEFVVAHEVAHEWWNAVVGSDSKSHPFVDEALANHSAILYFDRIHGRQAADQQIEVQLRLPYQLARMAGAQDRPVDTPTSGFGGTLEYAAIVYGKGGLFFDELRRLMGDSNHLAFLQDYYRMNRFRIAGPRELRSAMLRASRSPDRVRQLADRWLNGAHGDDDIGGIRLMSVATYLLGDEAITGELGKVLQVLDHKGVGELTRLVTGLLGDDGRLPDDLDWAQIVRLGLQVAGSLDPDLADAAGPLGAVADLLAQNPDLLTNGSLRGTVKQLAKSALGADEQTSALIDIADLLIKVLEAE